MAERQPPHPKPVDMPDLVMGDQYWRSYRRDAAAIRRKGNTTETVDEQVAHRQEAIRDYILAPKIAQIEASGGVITRLELFEINSSRGAAPRWDNHQRSLLAAYAQFAEGLGYRFKDPAIEKRNNKYVLVVTFEKIPPPPVQPPAQPAAPGAPADPAAIEAQKRTRIEALKQEAHEAAKQTNAYMTQFYNTAFRRNILSKFQIVPAHDKYVQDIEQRIATRAARRSSDLDRLMNSYTAWKTLEALRLEEFKKAEKRYVLYAKPFHDTFRSVSPSLSQGGLELLKYFFTECWKPTQQPGIPKEVSDAYDAKIQAFREQLTTLRDAMEKEEPSSKRDTREAVKGTMSDLANAPFARITDADKWKNTKWGITLALEHEQTRAAHAKTYRDKLMNGANDPDLIEPTVEWLRHTAEKAAIENKRIQRKNQEFFNATQPLFHGEEWLTLEPLFKRLQKQLNDLKMERAKLQPPAPPVVPPTPAPATPVTPAAERSAFTKWARRLAGLAPAAMLAAQAVEPGVVEAAPQQGVTESAQGEAQTERYATASAALRDVFNKDVTPEQHEQALFEYLQLTGHGPAMKIQTRNGNVVEFLFMNFTADAKKRYVEYRILDGTNPQAKWIAISDDETGAAEWNKISALHPLGLDRTDNAAPDREKVPLEKVSTGLFDQWIVSGDEIKKNPGEAFADAIKGADARLNDAIDNAGARASKALGGNLPGAEPRPTKPEGELWDHNASQAEAQARLAEEARDYPVDNEKAAILRSQNRFDVPGIASATFTQNGDRWTVSAFGTIERDIAAKQLYGDTYGEIVAEGARLKDAKYQTAMGMVQERAQEMAHLLKIKEGMHRAGLTEGLYKPYYDAVIRAMVKTADQIDEFGAILVDDPYYGSHRRVINWVEWDHDVSGVREGRLPGMEFLEDQLERRGPGNTYNDFDYQRRLEEQVGATLNPQRPARETGAATVTVPPEPTTIESTGSVRVKPTSDAAMEVTFNPGVSEPGVFVPPVEAGRDLFDAQAFATALDQASAQQGTPEARIKALQEALGDRPQSVDQNQVLTFRPQDPRNPNNKGLYFTIDNSTRATLVTADNIDYIGDLIQLLQTPPIDAVMDPLFQQKLDVILTALGYSSQ